MTISVDNWPLQLLRFGTSTVLLTLPPKIGRAPLPGSHRPFHWHIERPRTVDLLNLYVVRKISEAAGSSCTSAIRVLPSLQKSLPRTW